MRAVFMGTPEFSVPALQKMIDMGIEIVGVVTQPDKAKGRGNKVICSPVKEKALEYGLPIFQPVRIRKDEAFKQTLKELAPDVCVVIAFGQILPQDVLDIPRLGCVNIHASLLPKYRGAAPIQWSVIQGEKVTGVTTMLMDAGLDTGDMLMKAEIEMDPKETGDSLHDKLSVLGGELLEKTLIALENGTAVRTPQDHEQAGMYASMLTKEMGNLDFTKPAEELERLIRGLNSWPSAYTQYNDLTLKIWEADATDEEYGVKPGTVAGISKQNFTIQCGKGSLIVKDVQLQGKKRMDAGSFMRGNKIEVGQVLGQI